MRRIETSSELIAAKVGNVLRDEISLSLDLAFSTLISREVLFIWEVVPKDAESLGLLTASLAEFWLRNK